MKSAMQTRTKKVGSPESTGFPPTNDPTMKDLINIFKSLADPSRLRILFILAQNGEMHVSAICDLLQQSQPAVSHHLTQLKNAKLVDFRRNGKYNFYKLDSSMVSGLLDHFFPNATAAQQKLNFGDLELSFKRKG